METIRKYIQSLLFERKLSCAEWVYDKHFDSLDLATKNYLRKMIKSKEILDEIKTLFPSTVPSENESDDTPESDDDSCDDETYERRLEDLQRQRKRITDRIYLLKKKYEYSQETPESVFGDS